MSEPSSPVASRAQPDLPPVIGHRGAAGCAPENTLAGLRRAGALGCRWVEFDVRLTADGELVLLHDDRLDRTTDGRGKVRALPLSEIRRHDAGKWFDAGFAGERVPTLAEAIAALAELGIGANVELKSGRRGAVETGTCRRRCAGSAVAAAAAAADDFEFCDGRIDRGARPRAGDCARSPGARSCRQLAAPC